MMYMWKTLYNQLKMFTMKNKYRKDWGNTCRILFYAYKC